MLLKFCKNYQASECYFPTHSKSEIPRNIKGREFKQKIDNIKQGDNFNNNNNDIKSLNNMQHNICIQGLNYIIHHLDNSIVTKLPNPEEDENQEKSRQNMTQLPGLNVISAIRNIPMMR